MINLESIITRGKLKIKRSYSEYSERLKKRVKKKELFKLFRASDPLLSFTFYHIVEHGVLYDFCDLLLISRDT